MRFDTYARGKGAREGNIIEDYFDGRALITSGLGVSVK